MSYVGNGSDFFYVGNHNVSFGPTNVSSRISS